MRKNTLDNGEEDFYGALAANAGIGKIGTACYLCGKIIPREVARRNSETEC